MYSEGKIWVAKNNAPQCLDLKRANRHGLIAGATGTGKTTTLRILAESFSDAGVPVFAVDIKGDLSGLCEKGVENENMAERLDRFGLRETSFQFKSYPVVFWDVFQESGHAVRATVSDMGPILLSNVLELSEAQEGLLNIAFALADDSSLMLLDLKDLIAMLQFMGNHAEELSMSYGNVTKNSTAALIRKILVLQNQGGDMFFGEPALDFDDWMSFDEQGHGVIHLLEAAKLFQNPRLYSTFLLWMLNELYENLPEVGDLDKPKMIFFFDEAHLLFDDCPKVLLNKIEQIVRLVRSKGVGVYFITQSPSDLPDSVLAQLGNRIQHALRAYTPNEIKKVKAAADTFRANPSFDTAEAITNLGTGEVLLSFIDEKGIPTPVERTFILPPQSSFSVLPNNVIRQICANDRYTLKYDQSIDRESAYELLQMKAEQEKQAALEEAEEKIAEAEAQAKAKQEAKEQAAREKEEKRQAEQAKRQKQATINSFKRSIYNTVGREVTRSFTRSILGVFKK